MEKVVATRQEKPNKLDIKDKNIVKSLIVNDTNKDSKVSQNQKKQDKGNKKFCFNFKKLFCKNKDNNADNKYLNKKEEKIENPLPNNKLKKEPLKNRAEHNKKQKEDKKQNPKLIYVKKIFKNHSRFIGILLSAFVLFNIVLVISFANNPYYEFINRPKVLQYPNILVVLLLFSSILCVAVFFANLICLQNNNENKKETTGHKSSKSKVKKIICNLKPQGDHSKNFMFKKLKTTKQKKSIKYSYKKAKKTTNPFGILKLNIYIILMLLVLCLSFKIKVLWLCVISIFAVCNLNINLLVCNKTKQSKILNFIMLLVNICIFFSFYLVYLLN